MTLDQIALKQGTDKASNNHNYTPIYERYFGPMRTERLTLWEAGYGGYNYPDRGGQSARMWRDYFLNAKIVVTDLYPKNNVPAGVKFFQGSQDDKYFWHKVLADEGAPNVFIDDCSHICGLSMETFKIVFPLLLPGGWYVLEDCHSNYWKTVADDGTDFQGGLRREGTPIEFFKEQVDELNGEHSGLPNPFTIETIHFYNKIIFIKKKNNGADHI